MNHLESSFTGRNAFWRYLIMIVIVLVASNTIGAIPLYLSIGLRSAANPGILESLANNPNDLSPLGLDPNISLLMLIFPFIAGLAAFILFVKPLNEKTLNIIINGTNRFRWNRFFISALVWIVVSSFYLFANLKLDPSNFSINNISGTLIPLIIISIFLIPFQTAFEEVIFRGYLMQGFTVLAKNRWIPLLITAILFALTHGPNPEVREYGFWTMMPQYVLFGLIFGIITILDDGIEAAMGAHAANNAFLCIMVTSKASALQTPALFEQHNVYPWADFATMLIMGVLIILIMKYFFKWGSFSILFGKVEAKNVRVQIP
jgi:membrane protease YdiL (CAAX protease family)